MIQDKRRGNHETASETGVDGARSLRTAAERAAWCVRSIIRSPQASVSVAVPDASGRLRSVWPRGGSPIGGRPDAAKRRRAFLTGAVQRSADQRGVASAWIPLQDGDRCLGVLGVAGPAEALEDGWGAIEATARQTAAHLRSLQETEALRNRVEQGLAWVAHEFRGPILGVKAVLEGLVDVGPSPSDISILQRSIQEMEQLARTSEGLLAWAVGARPMAMASVDLVRIVEEAVASCTLTSSTPVLVLGPPDAFVRGDVDHLRVAVANLLRNAISVSGVGSKVEVEIELEHPWVFVKVTDQGPGLEEDETEVIFDPFVRGTTSSLGRPGNGLGLFITRKIVEAHAGRIWAESNHRGAVFCIQLPAQEGMIRCAS